MVQAVPGANYSPCDNTALRVALDSGVLLGAIQNVVITFKALYGLGLLLTGPSLPNCFYSSYLIHRKGMLLDIFS